MYETDPEYLEWKKTKNPAFLSQLLKKYNRLIDNEIPKYRGQLPDPILKTYAKKIAVEAIKNFDPMRSKLSTHIINNMLRLHRINYEVSGTARMPEDIQRGINQFKNAKEYFIDKMGREPSFEEMADELKWNKDRVIRTEGMMRKEVLSEGLEFSPVFHEKSDPRLDYLYHDLDPTDKIIFQYRTGYNNVPILGVEEIGKKAGISSSMVSIRAGKLAKQVQQILNKPKEFKETQLE